jgi:hypothetical protein
LVQNPDFDATIEANGRATSLHGKIAKGANLFEVWQEESLWAALAGVDEDEIGA